MLPRTQAVSWCCAPWLVFATPGSCCLLVVRHPYILFPWSRRLRCGSLRRGWVALAAFCYAGVVALVVPLLLVVAVSSFLVLVSPLSPFPPSSRCRRCSSSSSRHRHPRCCSCSRRRRLRLRCSSGCCCWHRRSGQFCCCCSHRRRRRLYCCCCWRRRRRRCCCCWRRRRRWGCCWPRCCCCWRRRRPSSSLLLPPSSSSLRLLLVLGSRVISGGKWKEGWEKRTTTEGRGLFRDALDGPPNSWVPPRFSIPHSFADFANSPGRV